MADELPARSLRFGELVFEVTDPLRVQPVAADLMVEIREYNGTIALSFGTLNVDGVGPAALSVCARLRLTIGGAMDLRAALDGVLAVAMPPKEKTN